MGSGSAVSTGGALPFRRIAVTVPPEGWFHGVTAALFHSYRRALCDLGLEVFPVPLSAFLPPDAARIDALTAGLRAFRPELALGVPHLSHALRCCLSPRRDGSCPNLFTDVLDIPVLGLWDHAPVELADQVLSPLPAHPRDSRSGAGALLRRVLAHPRVIHWSRDRGQTRLMCHLGFAVPERVIAEVGPLPVGFALQGTPGISDGISPVAFFGHLYQEEPAAPDPALEELASAACGRWMSRPGAALWDVLAEEIECLPAQQRAEFALDTDQTYFWHFAHRLIAHRAQTALRLHMLGGAGVPVACYGNLKQTDPRVPANLRPLPGGIGFGPELAAALARHPITIDVLNPGFFDGYSLKPLICFASGGFMLVDRKQHFVDDFGAAGEAVTYATREELAGRVELFLANPRYRREVADEIRARVLERHALSDVLSRVLRAAAGCEAARRPPAPRAGAHSPGAVRADLMAGWRSEPQWTGASVKRVAEGVRVVTPLAPWLYAAALPLPETVGAMRQPHLRLRLIVEAGRIGVAPLRECDGSLPGEQVVSVCAREIVVEVELPREGARTVLLRNTVEGETRVLVRGAELCERE
ncbi:MAG: glycosyltransferase family 1 protein [Acidobacteria bacterium]|nr:glycosyltransferase family 1 protein [Acidobacteriota bacterium]